MKNKKGFTIIEILVVIGIITVLTAVSFPAISNIRAKNRDTERIADIATIQNGLALFYSQATSTRGYPKTLVELVPKYVPADTLIGPTSNAEYIYIPLKRVTSTTDDCVSYHLGVQLELPSAIIDTADNFTSTSSPTTNGYLYCGGYNGSGIDGVYTATNKLMYDVHP